jgi:hypothetical protein
VAKPSEDLIVHCRAAIATLVPFQANLVVIVRLLPFVCFRGQRALVSDFVSAESPGAVKCPERSCEDRVVVSVCSVLQSLDKRVWQHPGKKLQFLMGRRGKSDIMMIGGTWEPSDGGHPEQDPAALIATAVRTYRAATGVDLSACTQWYVCYSMHQGCSILSYCS